MASSQNHLLTPPRLHHALKRLGFSYEYTAWKGSAHPYLFRCSKGHEFLSTAMSLYRLVDCLQCKNAGYLEQLASKRRLAGLELLDTTWSGVNHGYRMRCAQGHESFASGHKRNTVSCHLCTDDALLKNLAAKMSPYGVTLVSSRWRGKTAWYQMQCAQGHELPVRGDIRAGKPCRHCVQEQLLQNLAIAVQRNGWLLMDKSWRGTQHHYRLRCAEGHVGPYQYYRALVGKVCRGCAQHKRAKASRANAHFVAAKNAITQAGLRCLGRRKVGAEIFFHLQCPKNHLYRLPGHAVFAGRLDCVACAAEHLQTEVIRNRLLLAGIKLLALAWVRTGSSSQQLECRNGHVWHYRPGRDQEEIPRCAQCANITNSEKLIANATAAGITWLDAKWKGPLEPHAFRCGVGHAWQALGALAANSLECPRCQQLAWQEKAVLQAGLDRFESALHYRGGRCLGPVYTGAEVSYRLRCNKGHEWQGTASGVIWGRWCERCTGPNPVAPKGIEMLRQLAGLRGGSCLASRFIDKNAYYRFRCAQNHEWQSRPATIRQGAWCRLCADAKRLALVACTVNSLA